MSRISVKDKEALTAEVRAFGGQCAVSLLRRDGWNRFTMENLASEMGVAKGTIYNYFKDKGDVLSCIIQCRARLMADEITLMADREPDTCKLLRQLVEKYLRGNAEFRFLHTAVFEVVHKNSVSEEQALCRLKQLLKPLREIFVAGAHFQPRHGRRRTPQDGRFPRGLALSRHAQRRGHVRHLRFPAGRR